MKNNVQLPIYQNNNPNSEIKLSENEIQNLNIQPQYYSNIQTNIQGQDKELEELDGTENLRFNGNINNNWNNFLQQRLDSCDSTPAQYKFSIDLPNVSKQRLHEYLNDDLLNALEVSPNIPKLNSGIPNNKKLSISNENNDNNPNNLIGFSLYPQITDTKNNNLDSNQINNNNDLSKITKNSMNNVYNSNMNYNLNNANNYNNYNYINLSYNINNPSVYIPTKLRNKEQVGEKNQQFNTYQNAYQGQKKEEQKNVKNKFDSGNKKTNQNQKKEGKNKKHFEVRAGDWTCSKCNNLNFSFRNKCNRCGLPKELNNRYELNPEILNQNANYQLMSGNNSNYIYGNNINNNINNNVNNGKFYPK